METVPEPAAANGSHEPQKPEGTPELASELLARVAKLLRKRARKATPGPWTVCNDTSVVRDGVQTGAGSYTCIQSVVEVDDAADRADWYRPEAVEIAPEHDAKYIALMHPPVALALAALLEQHAVWMEQAGDTTSANAPDMGDIGHVVAVAQTVLRAGGAQ